MAAPMGKCVRVVLSQIIPISTSIYPSKCVRSVSNGSSYRRNLIPINDKPRQPCSVDILPYVLRRRHDRRCHFCTSATSASNLGGNSSVVRSNFSKMYENVALLETIPAESDLSCTSQRLMVYNGIIAPAHSGTYHLLPMGVRALTKLKRVIHDGMESIGAQELALPCLSPGNLWKASGRWTSTGSELFKLKDRHNIDHCLGPTHEEVITSLVATYKRLSHRQLPIKLYQITRKFRDEMAPKYGLLRGREFEMKDLYTFDTNLTNAKATYEQVCGAYERIFKRLGVKYVKVVGDTGNIGGQLSHEYHLTADVGEDNLVTCERCDFGANEELIDKDHLEKYKCDKPDCNTDFTFTKGMEVGHTFLLGTKYSEIFKAHYLNEKRQDVTTQMGCYGLGVTRILAAVVEVLSEGNRIRWPKLMAPYQICIIPQKDGFKSDVTNHLAESLYDALTALPTLHREVVIDDRTQMSIGKRVYHANRLGYPYTVSVGKKALESPPKFEVLDTYTGETEYLEMSEVLNKMAQLDTI